MISDHNCTTRSSITTLLHPFWNHTVRLSILIFIYSLQETRFLKKRNRKRCHNYANDNVMWQNSLVHKTVFDQSFKDVKPQQIRAILNLSEKCPLLNLVLIVWLNNVSPSLFLWFRRLLCFFGVTEIERTTRVILCWKRSWTAGESCRILGSKTRLESWKSSRLKYRIETHCLVHLALLLDMGNRRQRNSLFDGNRWIWGGPICSVLADFWRFACTILAWSFAESTDYVRKFLSLIFVNFVVVIQRRFPWMARDFTDNMARLTGFLQFGDECFSYAVVRNLLVSQETGSHGLHNGADCILAHSDFCVPDILWFWTVDYA